MSLGFLILREFSKQEVSIGFEGHGMSLAWYLLSHIEQEKIRTKVFSVWYIISALNFLFYYLATACHQ